MISRQKASNLFFKLELLELPIKFEDFRNEVNRRFEALEKIQEEIKEKLNRHEKSIQELKGWQFEHKVIMNICAYLGRYIKKCKVKDKSEIADELDEYVEKNIMSIAIEIAYKIGDFREGL